MLKPSSTSNMDQDYVEYYPHIVFLHNKAELQDFTPRSMEKVKVYIYIYIYNFFFVRGIMNY